MKHTKDKASRQYFELWATEEEDYVEDSYENEVWHQMWLLEMEDDMWSEIWGYEIELMELDGF